MEQQASDQIDALRVYEFHNTRDPSNPRVVIYGYISPTLDKREKSDILDLRNLYDSPISHLFKLPASEPIISLYDINDARGFRDLFAKSTIPEIQRVDLRLTQVKRVQLGNCAKQRTAYAYISYTPRHAQPETLAVASARLASRKVKVRYGLRRERAPYQLEQLTIDNGSRLHITMKCALCGYQRRITLTHRNSGRKTPNCSKCKKQILYVAKIKRVQNN